MKNNNGGNLMVSYALLAVLQVLLVILVGKVALGFMSKGIDNLPQLIELSSAPQEVIEMFSQFLP